VIKACQQDKRLAKMSAHQGVSEQEVSASVIPKLTGKVLLTGASGYLGLHIVHQLLEAGVNVRATVRNPKSERSVGPLKMLPHADELLEILALDMLDDPENFEKAVRGCNYVIHNASPFPTTVPKDQSLLIKPALDGTLNILKACHKVGGVTRVAITSSTTTIDSGLPAGVYDESSWSDLRSPSINAYMKSKTLAEQAAWKYVNALDQADPKKFELTTVCPSAIMGPAISDAKNTTMDGLVQIVRLPITPKSGMSMVDVRDVAKGLIEALTHPDAAGERFIMASKAMSFQEIGSTLRNKFGYTGYWFSKYLMPKPIAQVGQYVNGPLKQVMAQWGKVPEYNATKITRVMGLEYRPIEETLENMFDSAVEHGHLKVTSKQYKPEYKFPKGSLL
jgi:dihydroflavonol-4-reductase